MQKEEIRYLVTQYLTGQLTDTQGQELLALTNAESESAVLAVLQELMQEESLKAIALDPETLRVSLRKVLAVDKGLSAAPPVHRLAGRRVWWAAAAILVLLGAGSYVVFFNKPSQPVAAAPTQAKRFKNDVAPGGNKATLTLAGGQQIMLDSAASGVVAQQGNAQVRKLTNGQLTYRVITDRPTIALYNTLTTPRGGVYQLVLPDGSKVWLNSESSIKYPVFFTGKEREVEISGEAYFEVRKNASQPFRVIANGWESIEVLGTSFNVNAYPDERGIATALVSGEVRVAAGTRSLDLQPGQEAQGDSTGRLVLRADADIEKIVAWKEGKFIFEGDDLPMIMRQLGRWYDLDVRYSGKPPAGHYSGIIGRNRTLVEVLNRLRATNSIHFTLQDKTITIEP